MGFTDGSMPWYCQPGLCKGSYSYDGITGYKCNGDDIAENQKDSSGKSSCADCNAENSGTKGTFLHSFAYACS